MAGGGQFYDSAGLPPGEAALFARGEGPEDVLAQSDCPEESLHVEFLLDLRDASLS